MQWFISALQTEFWQVRFSLDYLLMDVYINIMIMDC